MEENPLLAKSAKPCKHGRHFPSENKEDWMKGLLIKDCQLLKKRGIFLLPLALLFATTGRSEVAVGLTSLIMGAFSITTISYDEYEKGMPFIVTLPVRRRDYVREKYIFGFIIIAATWLFISILGLAFEKFILMAAAGDLLEKLEIYAAYLFATCFLVSLQIAVKIRFEERSGLAMTAIGGVTGALFAVIYVKFNFTGFVSQTQTAAAAAAGMLALMYGFYRYSAGYMERREF